MYWDCILCIPTQIPLRHLPSMCAENVIGRANVSTVDMKGLNTGRSGSVFMRMLNLTMMRQFYATELERCMSCCSVDAKKARRERRGVTLKTVERLDYLHHPRIGGRWKREGLGWQFGKGSNVPKQMYE